MFELNLTPLDATITGRVTDPDGDGVAGLWIQGNETATAATPSDRRERGLHDRGPARGYGQLTLGGGHTPWDPVNTDVSGSREHRGHPGLPARAADHVAVSGESSRRGGHGLDGICVDLLDSVTGEPLTTGCRVQGRNLLLEDVAGQYTV